MVETVTLYRTPTTAADAEEIADWLRERLDRVEGGETAVDVEVRDRFLEVHRNETDGDTVSLAESFAEARVLSPHDRETGNGMLGVVRYEERALENPERAGGVLYDGVAVQRALNAAVSSTRRASSREARRDAAIPERERSLDHLHVALLDRAVGTWGDHDGRWHKRVSVLGQPALVSVPGLYEAPAKPETYYREKQKHALLSGDAPPREVLENEVEGEFLVADDPRTTEALKGYVLQAVHCWRTGEAFCEADGCRLSNPHRQPGVVRAQLRDPEFCERHAELYG